jgi:hypothetical protein
MNEAFIGLAGALFGGVALKVVERIFARGDKRLDEAGEIRRELRAEVSKVREELAAVRSELDVWKGRYYSAVAEWQTRYFDLQAAHNQLEVELEKMRKMYGDQNAHQS